ncbi:hypothetical protein DFH07DRAFT_784618 [Mycena maculata]|uniref:Uncharacterized protein n=1 Tax=Mycena maculata TaxID=230809 RepID=A0AAD7HFX9_9AGAR|nr:hypothetical protein DFH07DRAFT_784618 [Mycena maculata]
MWWVGTRKYAEAATWFIAASLDDGEFIKNLTLRLNRQFGIEPTFGCGGRVYSPNYGIAVSMDGDIVPASEVFDYDHPDFRPAMAIFKVFPPPSPFAPGPHFEQAETHGGTKEVIDLTMDDDDEYEERQATNQITECCCQRSCSKSKNSFEIVLMVKYGCKN